MNKSTVSIVLTILACANDVSALNQPDGTPIPQGNGLQGLFNNRGENFNALTAASKTPERFVPSCALTFTVLQRNAGYDNAFGWYNVTGVQSNPPAVETCDGIDNDCNGSTDEGDICPVGKTWDKGTCATGQPFFVGSASGLPFSFGHASFVDRRAAPDRVANLTVPSIRTFIPKVRGADEWIAEKPRIYGSSPR